jgi:four helix bundle protein
MEGKDKIKSFADLYAWQEGHKLLLMLYKETEIFPSKEIFGSSNIAEGFSRNSNKEKCQFYCMAQGSVTELQNQLLIARDVGYLAKDKFMEMAKQTVIVNKLISGLKRIKNTKYKIQDTRY